LKNKIYSTLQKIKRFSMNLKVMPQEILYFFSQKRRVKNLRYIFVSLTSGIKSLASISLKSKIKYAYRKLKSVEDALKVGQLRTGSEKPVKIALPDIKLT